MQNKRVITVLLAILKFSEKYLSVVKHESIYEALERLEGGIITLDTVLESDENEQNDVISTDEQIEEAEIIEQPVSENEQEDLHNSEQNNEDAEFDQ